MRGAYFFVFYIVSQFCKFVKQVTGKFSITEVQKLSYILDQYDLWHRLFDDGQEVFVKMISGVVVKSRSAILIILPYAVATKALAWRPARQYI